jgi:epsin
MPAAAATLNPWSSLQPTSGSNSATASPSNMSGSNKKNPAENFLGQNSALVDLDSLVTPVRPAAAAPSSAFMNPFTGPFSSAGVNAAPNNPFHQAAAPSPTINQLRSSNTGPYDSGPTLPQPLQPFSMSSTAAFQPQQQAPNRFQPQTAPADQNSFNPFL